MTFKTFTTLTSARTAIKNAGLSGMTVRYDDSFGKFIGAKRFQPVVLCDLAADKQEAERRGFKAEMKFRDVIPGATVELKPEFVVESNGLAVVKAVLDDIDGGIFLDRPLDGSRYWNIEALNLIAREEEAA